MTARHILTSSRSVLAGWLMVTEWGIILCQKETDPPLGLGPKTRNIKICEVTRCQAGGMVAEKPSGKASKLFPQSTLNKKIPHTGDTESFDR